MAGGVEPPPSPASIESERLVGEVSILGRRAMVVPVGADARIVETSVIQHKLLGLLAFHRPRSVGQSALIDAIWGESAPRTARAALQNQISRVRQTFGASIILTVGDGYALGWPTDLDRVVDELCRAESALADGDAVSAKFLCESVLGRFRTDPSDFTADAFAQAWDPKTETLRRAAEMVRLRSSVEVGQLGWALFEAERLVSRYPGDESCWALLAQITARTGRRGDALSVIDRARRVLRDQFGLDPGPDLTIALQGVLSSDERSIVSTRSSMVGRASELDAIDVAIGAGCFVVVRGEAGCGRSSVLAEIVGRARRRGQRTGFVRCAPHPAAPLAELDELLQELGTAVDSTYGLLNGFVRALDDLTDRPVLLVVDDFHLAGPSTIAMLRRAHESASARVVVSTDLAADWAWTGEDALIDLGPIPTTAIGAIAGEILGRELTPTMQEWLAALSGGNPSLLEQLLHDPAICAELEREGATDPGDELGGIAARRSIDEHTGLVDIVRRRLVHVGDRTRIALEVAAVCGDDASGPMVDELVPSAQGLTAALALGLLERSGVTTRFRHAAVQRVVYRDLSPGRRMELHHVVGTGLAARGASPAAVAHHLLEAAQLDAAAAVEAARGAADQATRQGAHHEAADWLRRAAECAAQHAAHDERLRVELLIARGDALRLAGEPEHIDLLFLAADLAVELDVPRLLTDAAFALLQLGSTSETGRIETRAAAIAELAMDRADDIEAHARVAAAASLTFSMSGHPDRCRELFVQAERSATSSAARRCIIPFAYLALGHPRDLTDRALLAAELRSLAVQAEDPTALFEALQLEFSVALQTADGATVRTALSGMESIIERVGDVGRRWALLYCTAALAHLEDRLDESERVSEAGMAVFMPVSPSRAFATYGAQLIALRLAQGRIHELAPTFEHLVVDQPGLPAWHAALALSITEIDPARAERHAARALEEVPEDFTWLASHVIGGRAAARIGTRETVERYRSRLLPWQGTACWQGTCCYGPVDVPLAALADAMGDRAAGVAHRERARSLARRLRSTVFEREVDEQVNSASMPRHRR